MADSYLIAPTTFDTQASLISLANTLQGLFAIQSAGVINGMTYDCPVFGGNNICVAAGGRYTDVSSYPYNNTRALILAHIVYHLIFELVGTETKILRRVPQVELLS
ncbi:hypothetical protein [Polynucleobacter necessarius]|uniref:hypothetical protein n=1 Tax=Polynucleobacter necessarius TaxID=576610 RepID=UPI000E08CDAA|nr:hypothetical protein [Polynucleobacter necessarius]